MTHWKETILLLVLMSGRVFAAPLIDRVTEARPIRFQKAQAFSKNGGTTAATDVWLIKVHVVDLDPFYPHDMVSPYFMVGNSIAVIIRSPLADGTATIVAPRPLSGESASVWLAPGVPRRELTSKTIPSYFKAATDNLEVPIAAPSAVPETYADLDALRQAQRKPVDR